MNLFQIGVTVHGELKIREFDKTLGREILSRDLTIEEIKFVVFNFNAAMQNRENERIDKEKETKWIKVK